ncbi:MAG: hypothetical protein IPO04_21440 [Cytophagaceae bacterium]|nr:hypothetical protein [Cytophagaceae bacterium]
MPRYKYAGDSVKIYKAINEYAKIGFGIDKSEKTNSCYKMGLVVLKSGGNSRSLDKQEKMK